LSVYLRGVDGSPAVRLGDGKALALSPDGRWALALSATDPRRLSLLPTGAGEPRELPPAAMDIVDARWRPGTNQILVSGTEPGKGLGLYILDIGTREARLFARTVPWIFAPSPDGSRVASWDGIRMHIYPLDGGEPQAVPGAGSQDRPLQWTTDGRALYVGRFFENVYRIDEIDLATGRRRLWRDLHLDSTRSPVWNVRMTPDGEAYAYDVRSSLSTLYLVKGLR
jgi:hypothetical protein